MSRFSSHFDTAPDEYERRRSGHLEQRRVGLVLEAMDQTRATAVAEVGCGTGAVLRAVAGARPQVSFDGFDVDDRLLAYARERNQLANLDFARVDVTRERVPGRFDLVFSIDTVHHLHDHRRAFDTIRRALAPGGLWLVIEPNIWHAYVTLQQERMRRSGLDEDHFRPWRQERLLASAGFRVLSRRYVHAIPGGIASVPAIVARAERVLERVPVLGASVVYELG